MAVKLSGNAELNPSSQVMDEGFYYFKEGVV